MSSRSMLLDWYCSEVLRLLPVAGPHDCPSQPLASRSWTVTVGIRAVGRQGACRYIFFEHRWTDLSTSSSRSIMLLTPFGNFQ